MDLGGFSALICELQATVTLAEQWIIIQHARFDFSVDSEPYHASQVLVNQETKEFIVRVWGKTFRKGTVSSISDLQDICKSALGPGAASCPGHYSDSLGYLFERMPSFTQLSHPFKRYAYRYVPCPQFFCIRIRIIISNASNITSYLYTVLKMGLAGLPSVVREGQHGLERGLLPGQDMLELLLD